MAETITIVRGDTSTGKLEQSDNGKKEVDKGVNIKWEIGSGSNVASIENITLDADPDDIFSEKPQKENSRKWKAKIKDDALDNAKCKYSIFWKATGATTVFEYDPIIAIRPR